MSSTRWAARDALLLSRSTLSDTLSVYSSSFSSLFSSRLADAPSDNTLHSSLTLSTEICEHIIDILAEDLANSYPPKRNRVLSACALTCRSWYPRSRLHLYSTAHVDIRQIKTFVASLTLNPSNGHLVQHLNLRSIQNPKHQNGLVLIPAQLPDMLPNLQLVGTILSSHSQPHESTVLCLGYHDS